MREHIRSSARFAGYRHTVIRHSSSSGALKNTRKGCVTAGSSEARASAFPPAIEPAVERFVRERFAQGWSRSRLARALFLDRRTVKRILQKV
jgi:ribosome-binding protein aMBF1 (putative translation factor)